MIVDAVVYHWTATGMRETGGIGEYIEKREAERLLEEAHRRGIEQGKRQAYEQYKTPTGM
jgi:hypothetical protein